MKSVDAVTRRIDELLHQVSSVVRLGRTDQLVDSAAMAACVGWIAAATHIVKLACASDPESSYIRQAIQLQDSAPGRGWVMRHNVLALAEMLKHLKTDIAAGLLTTLERQVSAETYDDLIDHASAYLEEGRKDPAGIIVAVVFEDTIRRVCRTNGIDDSDKTCEPLINALTAANVLTKLEAKEAKLASDLRANATHAWWDRFNADQVQVVINFTRRLLREKLAT